VTSKPSRTLRFAYVVFFVGVVLALYVTVLPRFWPEDPAFATPLVTAIQAYQSIVQWVLGAGAVIGGVFGGRHIVGAKEPSSYLSGPPPGAT